MCKSDSHHEHPKYHRREFSHRRCLSHNSSLFFSVTMALFCNYNFNKGYLLISSSMDGSARNLGSTWGIITPIVYGGQLRLISELFVCNFIVLSLVFLNESGDLSNWHHACDFCMYNFARGGEIFYGEYFCGNVVIIMFCVNFSLRTVGSSIILNVTSPVWITSSFMIHSIPFVLKMMFNMKFVRAAFV